MVAYPGSVSPRVEPPLPPTAAGVGQPAASVELRYFEGCPNWTVAHARLLEALRLSGRVDVQVRRTRLDTPEQAEQFGFVGSPTVLIDGLDPFAAGDEVVGLACRIFRTPAGRASGSPSLAQLVEVLS